MFKFPVAFASLGLALLFCSCFGPTGAPDSASRPLPDPGPAVDAGADAGHSSDGGLHSDAGAPDGGAGSVTTLSTGNQLPPPWVVTDAGSLNPDGGDSEALQHLSALTTLAVAVSTTSSPCPLPFTSGGGTVYCNGFSAVPSGGPNAVIIDDFAYLGPNPPCKASLPTEGAFLSSITGVWQDKTDQNPGTDLYVLALASCSGVGLGTAYAGTGTPPATTEVHALLESFSAGSTVTVKGVVVAVYHASGGAFGFAIEDPSGGALSAIAVKRAKTSAASGIAPEVGDYVTVTGRATLVGTAFRQIDLL